MAIIRKAITQNGEPEESTVAKILAKKSDAFGLRMFVKKPILTALSVEMSLCSSGVSAFCVSIFINNVFIPR